MKKIIGKIFLAVALMLMGLLLFSLFDSKIFYMLFYIREGTIVFSCSVLILLLLAFLFRKQWWESGAVFVLAAILGIYVDLALDNQKTNLLDNTYESIGTDIGQFQKK